MWAEFDSGRCTVRLKSKVSGRSGRSLPVEVMRMLIQVRYSDNTYDMLKSWRLQEFIGEGKITAFRRSDGWVTVEGDQVRAGADRGYGGPERRKRENNIGRAA